ncbi:DUF86 domain-containing protein [Owenweeksia hongkongensis]|uniref:HepT-like ribonuclease domain-containing protein n=1 Tax=Owenweeksia hongkongensis TaxID=253245 RepID=UPI003A8E0E9D
MSKRDNLLLLSDMLESAYKIRHYTETYDFEDFANDDKTIDAVTRNLEIIGETSNRIDPDFKGANPEIPWNHLTGLRNRIQEYFIPFALT